MKYSGKNPIFFFIYLIVLFILSTYFIYSKLNYSPFLKRHILKASPEKHFNKQQMTFIESRKG